MGVAGCGKTSIGMAVAKASGATYIDGDDLHPANNIAKMSSGQPLTDEDRWPWLSKVGEQLRDVSGTMIIGCSALKRGYRDAITQAAQSPVLFIYLSGSPELIACRMQARSGHFMPPTLLKSQFETLEPPTEDEIALKIDINQPLEEIVQHIITTLEGDTHDA